MSTIDSRDSRGVNARRSPVVASNGSTVVSFSTRASLHAVKDENGKRADMRKRVRDEDGKCGNCADTVRVSERRVKD